MAAQLINQSDLELNYDLYFNNIYKFFYYKVLSKEIAEDLTSETFLTYASILKTKKEIENLKHFLFGIAKNIFLKYLKQKYNKEVTFSSLGSDFAEYADNFIKEIESSRHTMEDKIKRYLPLVPEKQRIVLEMRLINKLNLKEIAVRLNKDMNYVKTTQKRGIRTLKDLIALDLS